MNASSQIRFWKKVDKSGICWIWTAAVRPPGNYGNFSVGRKSLSAHRASYELAKGPISDGMVIMHSCDNPRCVNPNHLFAGTQQENVSDCLKKGRYAGNQHLKKTYCQKGHEFTEENTYRWGKQRACKICIKEYHKSRSKTQLL